VLSQLLLGAGIGFVAGISPGPVLTLVLSETLRGGWPRGAAVAAGPLLADGPIVLLAVLVVAQLPADAVRALSLVGGAYLLVLAARVYRTSRRAKLSGGERLSPRGGLLQGLLARALTPHAYLFWFLVGAPLLVQAGQEHWLAALLFLAGYYLTIVGSNVVIALALQRWASRFSARVYRGLLTIGSLVLAAYGAGLLGSGLVGGA
jgi:threonine/homoserine/homoserine lactone efflux protein